MTHEPDPQQLEGERAVDRVPGRRAAIVIGAMAALTLATAAILFAVAPRGGESPTSSWPKLEMPPADPFAVPLDHELRRAAQLQRRERWEWVDPAHGRARRPLAAAIDAYLAERPR